MDNERKGIEAILLRPNELALVLGISRSKAYQLLRGELPGVIRIGRSIRISRRALEDWVQKQESACPDDG